MPVPVPAHSTVPAWLLEPGDLLLPGLLPQAARVLWRLDGPPVQALLASGRALVLSPHEQVRIAPRPEATGEVEAIHDHLVHAVAGAMLAQRDHADLGPSRGMVRALVLTAAHLTGLEPAGLWTQAAAVLQQRDENAGRL